eukprot:TRINITY_DN8710_c0_g1_i4.p1 TRINITY_DN8710_c0_g1~~TRINITY_DN8710_c0_g1_i4.p1  ORF type:complete len:203 (+),score=66.63 TRINITY_DN8710_c0_g1_i4:798-1406(+)
MVETGSVGLTEDSSAAEKNVKLSSEPNECTTENNKGEEDAVKETKAAEDGKESSEPSNTKTEQENTNDAKETAKEDKAPEPKENAPLTENQEDEKKNLGENKEEQKKAEDELMQENYAPFRRAALIEPKETDDSNVLKDKENIEKQLDTNKTDIPTKEIQRGEERAGGGENNQIKAEETELQNEEKIIAQEKVDKRSCCMIV